MHPDRVMGDTNFTYDAPLDRFTYSLNNYSEVNVSLHHGLDLYVRNISVEDHWNTSVDEDGYQNLYEVPTGVTALLSLFYGSISVIAVVGNSLVMWIVATSRRMQNVTNCFIANLALADIVIGLFAIPFQVSIVSGLELNGLVVSLPGLNSFLLHS